MVPKHIAALGSSFAAGPGILPQTNRIAMRSLRNYPNLLAKRCGAQIIDLTVSGATLQNVLSEPQNFWTTSFAPQLELLAKEASVEDIDLVTLTGGGNDLGYIGGMIQDGLYPSFLEQWNPKPEALTMEQLSERFIAIIDRVHKIAPKAQILLVEYLTILGPNTKAQIDINLTPSQVEHYSDVARKLRDAYRLAREARKEFCEVVPISDLSRNHGLGSEEPWVNGLDWGMMLKGISPLHPNAQGMEETANIIYEKIVKERS